MLTSVAAQCSTLQSLLIITHLVLVQLLAQFQSLMLSKYLLAHADSTI